MNAGRGAARGWLPGDSVDLVVVNYNTASYLSRCLESLRAHTEVPHRLIVVDSGSTDGSLHVLERWKDVDAIRLEANLGYAAAANRGLAAGRAGVAVVLNADTWVSGPWITPLLAGLLSDPSGALAGPKLLDRRGRIASAGAVAAGGKLVWRGVGEEDRPGFLDRCEPCLAISGACMAVRRALLPVLGPLDEGYFFYFEDVDYALTAQVKGYRVLYCPESVVYHAGQRSCRDPDRLNRYYRESLGRFRRKWSGHPGLPAGLRFA